MQVIVYGRESVERRENGKLRASRKVARQNRRDNGERGESRTAIKEQRTRRLLRKVKYTTLEG